MAFNGMFFLTMRDTLNLILYANGTPHKTSNHHQGLQTGQGLQDGLLNEASSSDQSL